MLAARFQQQLARRVWSDFSSESYKSLPSVGTITVYDPFTGEPQPFTMPAGGRGYTRVPSLISLWSTAPFLLNNSVGPFIQSHRSRAPVFLQCFHHADAVAGTKGLGPGVRQPHPGVIDRTTASSYLRILLVICRSSCANPSLSPA